RPTRCSPPRGTPARAVGTSRPSATYRQVSRRRSVAPVTGQGTNHPDSPFPGDHCPGTRGHGLLSFDCRPSIREPDDRGPPVRIQVGHQPDGVPLAACRAPAATPPPGRRDDRHCSARPNMALTLTTAGRTDTPLRAGVPTTNL